MILVLWWPCPCGVGQQDLRSISSWHTPCEAWARPRSRRLCVYVSMSFTGALADKKHKHTPHPSSENSCSTPCKGPHHGRSFSLRLLLFRYKKTKRWKSIRNQESGSSCCAHRTTPFLSCLAFSFFLIKANCIFLSHIPHYYLANLANLPQTSGMPHTQHFLEYFFRR